MRKKNGSGFSLLELLIVLTIVGILTAASLPLYHHYIITAKRLEAEIILSKLALALEEYYIIHNTYKNATLSTLGFKEIIADNRYTLAIATTDVDFKLIATPLTTQIDTRCATLTLNSQGEKGITGTGTLAECW